MVTIADVARSAGVGVSTAARVLSGRGYAGERTRERVLESAAALGYVPNRIARSLRERRTRLIGLLFADVENIFYGTVAKNVEAAAKTAGYHVVLANSGDDPDSEADYLQVLEEMQVAGLIVTPTSANGDHLRRLIAHGIFVVQIDRRIHGLATDSVLIDNQAGAEMAVMELLAAGRRRIAILTGPLSVSTSQDRLDGYKRALREYGIDPRPELIKIGSFFRDHALAHARALLEADPRPDAIFAANNVLAEAVLLAASEVRLRVPEDLAIIGFDDLPWMTIVSPTLATVRQPVAEMARAAIDLLLRRLNGEESGPSRTLTFDPELVIRDSVPTVSERERAMRRLALS